MKKIILLILIFINILFFSSNAHAYDTNDTGWVINEFNVNAHININQSINIEEEIKVDFNSLEKHGIFRYMPYQYTRNGQNYNVKIKIASITDKNNKKIPYEQSTSDGNLILKIGDPDIFVTGEYTYNIKYEILRAINQFSDYDEFYWNVTGNDWPVEIKKANIIIKWPDNIKYYNNICFTGIYGSTNADCAFSETENNKNIISFAANNTLNPGEGFTIVSGIEKGIIKEISFWQKIVWFMSDNYPYLIPIFLFIYLFYTYRKHGRDPLGKITIAPEFIPPMKLSPAVMGTLFDEKVDLKDISSVIIDLAVRGYLKIKETEKKALLGKKTEYEFIKTGKSINDLDNYEQEIYNGIFSAGNDIVKLDDLKNKFYRNIPSIKNLLYQKVTKAKYFEKNPETVRNIYYAIGGVLIFLAFFTPGFLTTNAGLMIPFMASLIISGIMIMIFANFMPKRTLEGVEANRKIKGFKLYMETAEKYKQKFYEDKNIFHKYLPYAMMFGIVDKWANAFKNIDLEKPDWYEGNMRGFQAVYFASLINNMQTNMNSALVSTPSSAGSGGSGFSGGGSGGGFGGGGGGSW